MSIDKSKLHHRWKILRTIKIRYVFVVFILSVLVSAWLLRMNNLRMVELRNAVVLADEQDGDIEGALTDLRDYVNGHMNTDLRSNGEFAIDEPPIQLVNQYNKAVRAAQEAAAIAGGNTADAALYTAAQNVCQSQGVPITAIAQCVQDYIAARSTMVIPEAVNVPKELYAYDFVSPKWSPDLAGFSVLFSTVVGLMLIARITSDMAMRAILKDHL